MFVSNGFPLPDQANGNGPIFLQARHERGEGHPEILAEVYHPFVINWSLADVGQDVPFAKRVRRVVSTGLAKQDAAVRAADLPPSFFF